MSIAMNLPLILPALLCGVMGYVFAEASLHDMRDNAHQAAIKSGLASALYWIGAGVALAGVVL
jgi:hypothetical protein